MIIGYDSFGRSLVSNTCRSLGGMDDSISVGGVLRDIAQIEGAGNIVGVLIKIENWFEGVTHKARYSIAHPVTIQFATEKGATTAARSLHRVYSRDDRGGSRTLKLEFSNKEMDVSVKPLCCAGLRVGLGKDIEFFVQPWVINKDTDEAYDIVSQPAFEWADKKDRCHRDFGGGTGADDWEPSYPNH